MHAGLKRLTLLSILLTILLTVGHRLPFEHCSVEAHKTTFVLKHTIITSIMEVSISVYNISHQNKFLRDNNIDTVQFSSSSSV